MPQGNTMPKYVGYNSDGQSYEDEMTAKGATPAHFAKALRRLFETHSDSHGNPDILAAANHFAEAASANDLRISQATAEHLYAATIEAGLGRCTACRKFLDAVDEKWPSKTRFRGGEPTDGETNGR